MKSVILAAGVGSRLMPLTRNTPKSLIDLGNGYSLLEMQLKAIEKCGLREIVLVTGYKSEQIEAKVVDYKDFDFTIVFNPFYRIANNIVSAWFGLKDLEEPAVILNGDDVFHPRVLQGLLESQQEITMVVSRKKKYSDEDMKVITNQEFVLDVGKDIPLEKANGESIGMILCRGRGLLNVKQMLLQMLRSEDNFQLFYLSAFRRLIAHDYRIHFSECRAEDWAEVDFHPDLEEISKHLFADLPPLF